MPQALRVFEKVVPGAYGIGKVKVLYKPRKVRKIKWHRFIVYAIFFFLVYLSYSWNVLQSRYSTVIPVVRWVFKQVDTAKWLLSSIPQQIRDEKMQEVLSRKDDIVRIEAASNSELFFRQGQHHALDRHYQLEIYRRLAMGNLSAIMGNKSVEYDITAKTLNFAGLAQQDLATLDSHTLEVLEAYSNGINSVILTESYHTLPLDFAWSQSGWAFFFEESKLSILPWEPVHSLAVARLLYYEWSHGWEDELLQQLLEERLGKTKAASFKTKFVEDILKVSKNAEYLPSLGGNVIAVGKDNSKSGSAFLVHDLQTTGHHFGFWYANALKAGQDYDVSGLSFPGIPYVLIGRNAQVSWAFVRSQQRDLEDIFLVKKKAKTDIQFTARTESIVVRRSNLTMDFQVMDCEHGTDIIPMLSNAAKGAVMQANIEHIVLASQAINKPVNLDFFRLLNQAQNVENLHTAAQKMESVALNLVYATADGNVGYIHTGSVPVRAEGSSGNVPMSLQAEHVWKGGNDPHDENIGLGHSNGVIIAADSLSSKALFRRLASGCFDVEKNIAEHCGMKEMYSTRKYSLEDMESILVDAYSPTGHAFSTFIQAMVYSNEEKKPSEGEDNEFGASSTPFYEEIEKYNIPYVMDALHDFDGYYHPNSVAPTVIEAFRTSLLSSALRELGPLNVALMGVPIGGILRPMALDNFRYSKTMNFFKHGANRWMLERFGSLDRALLSSLSETFSWIDSSFKSVKELTKPSNKNMTTPRGYVDWTWADAHLSTFSHPVTPVAEILDTFWSVGPERGIGGLDTVLRSSYRSDIGLSNPDSLCSEHSFITSNRMAVDMGSKEGFKSLHTPVGPSIRLAFDVNFDQKFHQLFSPALKSKHVVGSTCGSDGVCVQTEKGKDSTVEPEL